MVKLGGAHYADVILSELLCKGAHTTTEDLDEPMSKCWKIAGGYVSDNGDDSIHNNGHKAATVNTDN